MIKPIVKDDLFLMQKGERATKDDIYVVNDLLDTLKANEDRCVGMAANMIGINKNIIVIKMGMFLVPMINPVIKKYSKETYETEESCLSHDGFKKVKRYQEIEVEFYDRDFKKTKQCFQGFVAQIIQHEIDHLKGILI